MSHSNYVLALDVGERRIGVAIASSLARLPAPLMTIDRNVSTDVYEGIKKLVEEQQAETIVVGLPRGLDGQETGQTLVARNFAHELSQVVKVPVVLQDEAGTSIEAERLLKERGKNYEKADIDAEAATLILRDYLNELGSRTA